MVTGTNEDSRSPAVMARFPLEVAGVWALLAGVTLEILVTYSRLPSSELYNVSHSGLAGGLSRALVFWNWPGALVAIPILALLADRLRSRGTTLVALAGIVISAAVFWPGIIRQSNLDARAVNAVPAVGALVAVGLSVIAARRLAAPSRPRWQRWDRLRVAIAVATVVLAVPWLFADLGFSFDGAPVLGTLYQSGELRSEPPYPADVAARPAENIVLGAAPLPDDMALHPAVHHGSHHGMTGVLLIWSVLLLSRIVPCVGRRWLRGAVAACLALMFCYGAGMFANDFWLEQLVKRGWTDWSIPNVNNPTVGGGWAVILASTFTLWCVTVWLRRRPSSPPTV